MKLEINKSKAAIIVAFIIGIIGLLVAGYLVYAYAQPNPLECGLGGGCDIVKNSPYANFIGIGVPTWGLLFYIAIVLYTGSRLFSRKLVKFEKELFLLVTTAGLAFSMYLTYLEAYVIEAWCQWCLVSAVCSAGLFIASAVDYKISGKK